MEQLATRGAGGAGDLCVSSPLGSPYIGVQGAWCTGLVGGESNLDSKPPRTSTRTPSIMGIGESYSKEDSSPLWRPHLLAGQGSLGGLPPKLGGGDSGWYCPEPSGTFHDLLEASRTFQDLSGWFPDIPDTSGALPGPSGTSNECSGTI